jgi:hypothetical protein
MIISFYIHYGNTNTLILGKIKSKAQLETIKLITKNSQLLFNALTEDLYPVNGAKENYAAHDLTIYLPNHDENFNLYGNFEHLFTHGKYLNWKEMIIAQFPELSEQFTLAEKEAKNRQKLYRLEEKLKCYTQENGRYSFHHNEDLIKLLQQQITELHQELDSEARNSFDFH